MIIETWVLSFGTICKYLLFITLLFIRVWTMEQLEKSLSKKSKMGLHLVIRTPKKSLQKLTLLITEQQQLPDIAKTDRRDDTSCIKQTKHYVGRNICVHFQTNTHTHTHTHTRSIEWCRILFREQFSPQRQWKGCEIEKIPKTRTKASISLQLLGHILQAVILMCETPRQKWTKFTKTGWSLPSEHFQILVVTEFLFRKLILDVTATAIYFPSEMNWKHQVVGNNGYKDSALSFVFCFPKQYSLYASQHDDAVTLCSNTW